MKKTLFACICSVALVSACATDEGDSSSLSSDDGELSVELKSKSEPVEWQLSEDVQSRKEATLGEETADEAGIQAGCTFIQWCNEPGYWGTVCVWEACSFADAVRECTYEANRYCGRIVQPAVIR